MTESLSRTKMIILGLVVCSALLLGGTTLTSIANKQGLWRDTIELTLRQPTTDGIIPGTPVRMRGVEAGSVVAVDYPETDDDPMVVIRMRIDAKYSGRLYADAAAQVQSNGLLGTKVIAIMPGKPQAGELNDGRLRALDSFDPARTAAKIEGAVDKISVVADETRLLVHEIRTGQGTLGKLVHDDDLYRDLRGTAADARATLNRTDKAVAQLEGKVKEVQKLVDEGSETMRSLRQGTDAVQRLPIVRGYVEDSAALLVRPTCRREEYAYAAIDLFEPGTAILTEAGRNHLKFIADTLKNLNDDKADVVISSRCDPNDKSLTSAAARELSKERAMSVIEYLKSEKAHKTGWVSRRKMTALGLGVDPSPVKEPGAAPYLLVSIFHPQG